MVSFQRSVIAGFLVACAASKPITTLSPSSSAAAVPTGVALQGISNSTGPQGVGAYLLYANSTEDVTESVLGLDIQQKAKKTGYSVLEIDNYYDYILTAQLQIGSNLQKVKVMVDTGSTDLWVTSPSVCSSSQCSEMGSYDPSKSTSAKDKKKNFTDSYGDGAYSLNEWYQDTVYVSDMKFKNLWFGSSKEATKSITYGGIMGLSFADSSKTVLSKFKKVAGAKKQGFGVYTGPLGHGLKGSIVFGGIDHAKVDGDLSAMQAVNADSLSTKDPYNWMFLVNGTSYGDDSVYSTTRGALLDTGCTVVGLARSAFSGLVDSLKAKNENNQWTFDCPSDNKNLTFTFAGGMKIGVPLDTLYTKDGNTCTLAHVVDMGIDNYQLGMYFLRYAYVYFDANKKSALIGKVKFTTDTDIQVYNKDVTVPK